MLDVLTLFMHTCKLHAIAIHPAKCELFRREVIYCGLHVSEKGVVVDPARAAGLRDLPSPKTVGDVWQFTAGVGWIRRDIPIFSEPAEVLNKFITQSLKGRKRRDMRTAQRVKLQNTEWGAPEKQAWEQIRNALLQTITSSYRDRRKVACLFTDASDKGWSLAITQCEPGELDKSWAQQQHELLAVDSGCFRHAQVNWDMSSKEAYPITVAVHKHAHLLQGNLPFASVNDHKSLKYVFDGPPKVASVGKPDRARLARWATYLRSFNFQTHHIPGSENHFCDLLSRNGCAQAADIIKHRHECDEHASTKGDDKEPTIRSTRQAIRGCTTRGDCGR